jgi:hypothetical protein
MMGAASIVKRRRRCNKIALIHTKYPQNPGIFTAQPLKTPDFPLFSPSTYGLARRSAAIRVGGAGATAGHD